MTKRDFLKVSLTVTAAVAGSAILGDSLLDKTVRPSKTSGRDGKMKVLVITGSPRRRGNSNTLADWFVKGATEAGNEVVRFDSAFKRVHPCTGCNHCGMDGPCRYKDDFETVRNHIINSDVVAFASPMYYFGLSAQLKAVIDRFYAINGSIHVPKKAVLMMTYANTASSQAKPILSHYEVLLEYLGWKDAGRVIASGVWPVGAISQTKYPEQAYQLGKRISLS